MSTTVDVEKELTANQLYKTYKDEGGTLKFSDWLTREKTKGVFPINSSLNNDVQETIKIVKEKEMKKTYLGFPVSTLLIAGGVIVVAVVIAKMYKGKK